MPPRVFRGNASGNTRPPHSHARPLCDGPGVWIILAIAAVCCGATALPITAAAEVKPAQPVLTLVDRTVTQDQSAWIVEYRLRHTGATGVIVTPEEIAVKVEGWVSNSRVASHAIPRWSSLAIAHGPDLSVFSEVIAADDEAHRCRERLVVAAWTEDRAGGRHALWAAPAPGRPASKRRPTRPPRPIRSFR